MAVSAEGVLTDLWERKSGEIRRAAKRALRSHEAAEDVTAQVFIRVAEALRDGYITSNLDGLLSTITPQVIVDEQRAANRRPVPTDQPERGTTGWPSLDLASFTDDFDSAVRLLPEEQRDAFILTELRGLTVREAAGVLDAPRSTVSWRSDAALTTLKGELS